MLNEKDIRQLQEKGISKEAFLFQIEHFKNGFPPLDLDRPATRGDGILAMEKGQEKELISLFDAERKDFSMVKFVPASGAATRMFRDAFRWRDLLRAGVEVDSLIESQPAAAEFFQGMRDFAFWEDLKLVMDKDDLDADHLLDDGNYLPLLEYLMFDPGLDYSSLPKALIAFHKYNGEIRTAMEEHMVEAVDYVSGLNGRAGIHFTLSPEHIKAFRSQLEKVRKRYEQRFGVSFDISWSVQKQSTDTIAVKPDNLPFREKDGSLLFRPGGHGALIENLNELDEELIFIKNIDNVVPDRLKGNSNRSKKVLGGLIIRLIKETRQWISSIEKGRLTDEDYARARDFACNSLNVDRSVFPDDPDQGSRVMKNVLNRPLRVCGMVKNEGEPGGGPFWVKDRSSGRLSLQIVEMSQIDMDNEKQAEIVARATHFNPVDLVCHIRDYRGKKFELGDFIDKNTGFISHKSKDGNEIKALERPGLWNGAMAGWNTVFVEVPLISFNPVKTINDLLRDKHR